MKKILFVCKKRNHSYDPYGMSFGLLNSCRFVGEALEENFDNISFKVVVVEDNNRIDREVYLYKPTHVIIEALWVVPEKLDVLLPRYPGVMWNVRLHSKAPFIAGEGIAFEWLKAYVKLMNKYQNFGVSSNDASFTRDLTGVLGVNVDCLPNIYIAPVDADTEDPSDKDYHHDSEALNIGCFGAVRPLKNHLEQAIAAMLFAKKLGKRLHFHINFQRTEQNGGPVLHNLRSLFKGTEHKLVEHAWHSHGKFIKIVKKMDLGMQLSFSESFNIVAADFVANDVPIVVSEEISWTSSLYQVSTTDTDKIVKKLSFALKFKNLGLQRLNKIALSHYNGHALGTWFSYLYHS